jgi:hypothetical protein
VPDKYKEDNKLGRWVGRQRAVFKTDEIDPERKAKLNEVGFAFNPKGMMTNEDMWDFQFQKLRAYYEKHGHCELFWAVDRLTSFILNTLTNIPHVSLPELQALCQTGTRKTRHWALGSRRSVHASKLTKWIRNERRSSTRLVSISISRA